jgi:hypothetical protein
MALSPPLARTPFTASSASPLIENTRKESGAANVDAVEEGGVQMECRRKEHLSDAGTDAELFTYRKWQFQAAVERRAGRELSEGELRHVFKDPAFLRMEAEQQVSLTGYTAAAAQAKTDTAKSAVQVFEARKAAYKRLLERMFGHAFDDEQLATLFDTKAFEEVEAEDHAKLRAMAQDVASSTDINTLMMLAAVHRDHAEKTAKLTDSYAGLFEELRTCTAPSEGRNTSQPEVHPIGVLQTHGDGSGLDSMKAGLQKAFGKSALKRTRKNGRSMYAAEDTSAVLGPTPASTSASASLSLSAGRGGFGAGNSTEVLLSDGDGSSTHAKADASGDSCGVPVKDADSFDLF